MRQKKKEEVEKASRSWVVGQVSCWSLHVQLEHSVLSVQDIVKASVCLVVVAQWSQFSGRSSVVVA